jgi:catechol 2,3-dioxygenase-like lactoylglutathione lyase family enzyme
VSRLDHVAIVVASLDEAKRFFVDVLGLELVTESVSVETAARYAFFQWGDVQLELLEITDPEKRHRRVGDSKLPKIEHLGVAVDDLDKDIEELRARGVRTTTERPYAVNEWRYYFTEDESTDGIVYQFFGSP